MKMHSKIVVGFDLGNDTSQISYSYMNATEPTTLSCEARKQEYNIPTVLGKKIGDNQWFHGMVARDQAVQKHAFTVDRLLQRALAEEVIRVEEVEYSAIDLLTIYFNMCLEQMKTVAALEQIQSLVITVAELNEHVVSVLNRATSTLPLRNNVITYHTKEDAFFHYTVNVFEKAWEQQVLLVDGTQEYLKLYRLEMNKNTTPMTAFVEKMEYPLFSFAPYYSTNQIGYEQKYEYELKNILNQVLENYAISAMFFLGDEFVKDWFQNTLQSLCQSRRVFIGNNLFSKGATYVAKDMVTGAGIAKNYTFLGNDTIKSNVYAQVRKDGIETTIKLIEAGVNWYEVFWETDFILDKDPEITLTIESFLTKQKKTAVIVLEGLPERPRKATRIYMKLTMGAENVLQVQVEDRGFGELYPTSELQWNQEIDLE